MVLPDPAAVAEAAAERFVGAARAAIRARGRFVVALSGGSTPRAVYNLLASPPRSQAVDWSRLEIFWGDERAVPPDDTASNYGLARALLLDRVVGLRARAVHRMPADAADREAAARRYQATIARAFDISPSASPPAFDLIWLGMGADGHTASLFPGSTALAERQHWVVPTFATSLTAWRMTFTLPLINAARSVLFVANGPDKATALRQVRRGSATLPAARVRAASTLWLIDAAAAGVRRRQ